MRILYLCDRQNHCPDPCCEECHHTLNPEFSINYKGTIPLFEELEDQNLFECVYHFSEGTKDYWEIDPNVK